MSKMILSTATLLLLAAPASAQTHGMNWGDIADLLENHNISVVVQGAAAGYGGDGGEAYAGNGGGAFAGSLDDSEESTDNTANANGGDAYSGNGGDGGDATNTNSGSMVSDGEDSHSINVVLQGALGGDGGDGGSAYAGSGGDAVAIGSGNTANANGGDAYAGNGGDGGDATNTNGS